MTQAQKIHPTAQIDPKAELDSSVEIGAFTVVGPNVRMGAGTRVGHHTVVEGYTTLGRDNSIGHFASVGGRPQDMKYRDEPTQLIVGDRNTIREFTTIHTGTAQDAGITSIGDDNWIMAYVHIAHDCRVGNHTVFSSNAQIAGHVEVGDWAILGGMSGVHQFVRIGAHAMLGGRIGAGAGCAAVRDRRQRQGRQQGRTARHQRGRPAPPWLYSRADHRAAPGIQAALQERSEL